ncbi:phosphate regulon sensor histidine kinase PhoR [Woeseia oceani]|nr:phosphate regulon sensor histidine kinase PhoR [Woeseia oceani]
MPNARRKYLTSIVLLLVAGMAIGWLYDAPLVGLLVASLLALAHQIRQLLTFERALMSDRLDDAQLGDGIWSQLLSRVSYFRQRSRKYKRRHRLLLKEVRNSTNAMPDGGIVLNRDFEIVLSNQAAETMIGVRMPQDRGQRIDNILRDPVFVAYLKSANRAPAIELASPLSDEVWLSCRLVPFGAEQHLLLIRDVTETIRVNRMRRDFVANASHELRSPLTVISGYLDTLSDDPDMPNDWQRPLAQMRTQAERMNRVVAELLELSRLENPRSMRDEQDIDVGAVLAFARRGYAGEPGVPEIVIEAPLTARLHGVSAEIETVVSNLLANAIRHTPAEGRITLSWMSAADGGACLSVTDTGEGVPEEYIPRLTERFFRVDSGRSRDAGGVGLGLAIVKHALMRHDAQLDIKSTPGEGSRFSCNFPAARVIAAEPVPIDAKRGGH